jgi:hypothetical protein
LAEPPEALPHAVPIAELHRSACHVMISKKCRAFRRSLCPGSQALSVTRDLAFGPPPYLTSSDKARIKMTMIMPGMIRGSGLLMVTPCGFMRLYRGRLECFTSCECFAA